jgi:hypothetical protein
MKKDGEHKDPDESPNKPEVKKDKFRLSKPNLILPVLYVSLLFVFYFIGPEKTLDQMAQLTARMIGTLVITTLFTWLIWRLTGRKRIVASLTLNIIMLFLILGFIANVGDGVNSTKVLSNIEKSKETFKKELSNTDDPVKIESERQKYIDSVVSGFESLSANSTGDKKKYYEIMGSHTRESLMVAQNWKDSLMALQSPAIFDYSLLSSDEEFARRRSIINQYIENTIAYKQWHDNMIDTLKSKLSVLGEEKRFVEETVKGATEQYNAQKEIFAQFIEANLEYGKNMICVLDLLQNNKDLWYYENGELLINSDSVLNQFNDIIKAITDNTTKINELSYKLIEVL